MAVPTQEGGGKGPRRAGPRLKRVWAAAAAPQCDCVGGLRWRQPIPLTTIRQDYNLDYRLLTLNACIVLPDQSQGPFDNFIEMLARSTTTLGATVKKLSPTTVALPRRWARWRGLGEGLLAFRKIPFPLSLFAHIAYKI